MQWPLTIWYHPKPNREYYCEGFVTRRLSDMARHLQNYGYYAHQRIEVRNAATDKVMGQTWIYDALRGVANGRVRPRQ
jgi:hypothetical protein